MTAARGANAGKLVSLWKNGVDRWERASCILPCVCGDRILKDLLISAVSELDDHILRGRFGSGERNLEKVLVKS